jgi:CHAT domain-containing protein/tetratricopeptide (TPR) repeat protein
MSELAGALIGAKTEQEQDLLLAQKQELMSASLFEALKVSSNSFVQKGNYQEALRISFIAYRVAQRLGDRDTIGIAQSEIAAVYGSQNKPKDSLDYLQKSLAIFEETNNELQKARTFHSIGYAYGLQRRYDLGLEYHTKSLELSLKLGNKNLTALSYNSLGLDHTALGHYELGLEFYQKSRALCEEIKDKSTLNLALNNIATHYITQGRYAEALDYLQKSVKMLESMGSEGDRRSMAYKLQNIGLLYRHQGRYEQAFAYASRSLKILEEIGDKFGIANLQNNIGVILKSQGQYEESLEWFRKSNQGYQALQATPGIARTLNNIGDVYRLQGRYSEALVKLQESLKLREANGDRAGVTLSLNNLGRLYQDQGNYAEALAIAKRSAEMAHQIYGREELWDAQDRMGRALTELGQYDEAKQSYLAAISTIETLRKEVAGGEQQQQSFLENKLSPWFGMVRLLVIQKKNTEALTFAEQSKARVLLDTLQGGRSSLRQLMSPTERQAEEERRLNLVNLNSQLTAELRKDKPEAKKVTDLKANVEKARLEYEDFETTLYVAHPELKVKRGESPVIKPEELSALLPDANTALLEYVVGSDESYLFVVTKGEAAPNVNVYRLPIKRAELISQTNGLREQLARRDLGFRASAMKLYDTLLKPAEAQLKNRTNLIIAPDNILWDLPFQALPNTANRFLIEDAAITYAPSLTVLREMRERRNSQPAAETSLLALGNPSLGREAISRAVLALRDEKLEPLPEAEEEVKALKRLYGTSRSKVYIGADAREDRVKSEATRAKVIHFATHGILNNASPMYSYLALAEGGVNEDGLLEAWELMQMDLHADLAVLSACETARGRIGAGEGMIGFSWAMFIAGVPSIVVSQWKVESAGTRDLMVNFHRSLISPAKNRVSKSESLRQASLKLMKNPETSHPFYWASFVMVGDGR